MVDHQKQLYEIIRPVEDPAKAEETVNWLMNQAIRDDQLKADKLSFQPSKTGFLGLTIVLFRLA